MKLKFRFLFVPVCMVIAVLCVFSACSSETKTDSDTHKHVWNEGKIITQATCTTAGETEYACTVEGCTQTRTEIVIALGHDKISHEAVEPTCTEKGHSAYVTCSRCEYSTYQEIPALNHDEIPHGAVEPTCTEKGHSAYVTCSRCEYSTYQEIPALNHDEIPHGAVEPTCTEKGHNAYVSCSRCEYSTYQEIPALNHDLKNYPAQDPTCTADGWTAYEKCERNGCNYSTKTVIPTTGHSHELTASLKPTCLQNGSKTFYCDACGDTYTETVQMLGHDEIPHEAVEPTCTEKGHSAYVSCSRCEYSTYQEIPALNHDLKNYPAQDPTCTADGWTAYEKCERNGCNYSTKTVIPTTGHSHELTASLKPTCLQNGSKTFYCDACGDTYTETVQKLGHDIQYHAGKPATCTEDGYKSYYTCSRCNYTTYESVTALGHTINANGYCTNCKTQIETYICEIVTMPTLSTVYAGAKPTISGGVVKANGQTVTGVWSIESTASASVVTGSTLTLTSTETFLLTFTPSNTAIYKPVSAEVALTFHAVAQYNGLYYSTLDGALAAANAKNSGTVTALPSTYQTETSAAIQKAKTISSVTEIRSGVTLALPWAGSGVDTSSYSRSEKANVKDVTLLALSLYNGGFAFKGKNLVNQVWIDCNLTNNGTITIGGMIAAQSSAPASCISTEKYAQITLCADAVLTNNGTLNCYGYIQEAIDGESEIVNNAKIQMPFSLVEQRGGKIFLGYYQNGLQNEYTSSNGASAPFNRFFVVNCFVKIIHNPYSSLSGYVDLYANSDHQETVISLIETNKTTAMISLSTQTVLITETADDTLITTMDFYGGFSVNPLSLTLTVLITATISTEKVLLPVSWYYNIYMHPYQSGANATVNLTQDVKLLPGTIVEIDAGVTVNADYLVVYESFPAADTHESSFVYYTENGKYIAYEKAYNHSAKLVVNGTLNANTLGGTVKTQSDNAVLNVKNSNQAKIREFKNYETGTLSNKPIFSEQTISLSLPLYKNGTTTTQTAATGLYLSYKGGWINQSTSFTLQYVFTDENGNPVTDVNNENNPTTYALSQNIPLVSPTRATNGYALEGWYLDAALTQKVQALNGVKLWNIYHGNATLYGKFIQAEQYTVSFDFDNAKTGYSLSYSAISVIEGATINLADYTALQEVANTEKNNINAAYLFDGWYTGDQKVETFTVTQNVTLKAKWIQKIKLTLNLQNGSKDCINSYSLQINGATVASGSPGKTNQTFTFYVTVGDTVSLSVKSESGFFGFGGAAANILLAGTTTNVPKGETKSVSHTITSNNASGLEIVVKNT